MLDSLQAVQGYDEFCASLKPKLRTDRGWRAEVIALHEINKPEHRLIKISSSDHSGAEGLFAYQGHEGLLEVASVAYTRLFSNDERASCENSFSGTVGSIRKHLSEIQGIWCIVDSADGRGAKADLTATLQQLQIDSQNEWTLERSWGKVLYTPDYTKVGWYPLRERFGEEKILLLHTQSGASTMYDSPDYTAKVLRVLKQKQKQHSGKSVAVKLYYLQLETGIDFDDVLDVSQLIGRLKSDEALVLSALQAVGSGHLTVTRKDIYPAVLSLDLSNKHYPRVANSDEARSLLVP